MKLTERLLLSIKLLHVLLIVCLSLSVYFGQSAFPFWLLALFCNLIALMIFSLLMIVSSDNGFTRFLEQSLGEPLANYGAFITRLIRRLTDGK